jgi:hypothetical protein
MKGCQVGRLGRVGAIRCPLPDEHVRLGGECDALKLAPELQVLANLLDADSSLDVSGPAIGLEACRHRPDFASPFWYAGVELGSDRLDGAPISLENINLRLRSVRSL